MNIVKNVMDKIKDMIKNHKKLSLALLLLITVSIIGTVVLLNKPKTVEQPNVTETKQEVKDEKKTSTKEDKKSDEKKKDNNDTDKKSESKTSDKKEDVKADDKKADTKAEETNNTTSNTTVAPTDNTTSTTSVTPKNDTPKNTETTTSNKPDNVPAPCVPTYTTVNHPAVGHYEQREIMPAYNKPIYAEKLVGGQTGRLYNNTSEFLSQDDDFSYSVQQVQVDTEYVPAVYDNVWVEDQPAYTTTEASGC